MMDEFTFGSLFSGVGGMDLGLEWAGMDCRWLVEWEEYPQSVLNLRWPDVPKYSDVRDVDPHTLEPVDLICGGFPCQPHSVAASDKRKGMDDERWLWPEFFRIARVLRPRYILVENVPGLLTVNDGGAFREILGDLSSIRYDTEWDVIPALAFGAPHLRYRLFIVAYPKSREDHRGGSRNLVEATRTGRRSDTPAGSGSEDAAAPDCSGRKTWPRSDAEGPGGRGRRPDDPGGSGPMADADSDRQPQPIGVQPESRGRTGARGAEEDVADPNQQGLEGHPGDGDGRPGRTQPGGHASPGGTQPAPEIPDATRIRGGSGDVWRGREPVAVRVFRDPRPYLERGEEIDASRRWWKIESGLGGSINGPPPWLDYHIGRGMTYEQSVRSREILSDLWSPILAQAIQRTLGGLDQVQTAQILFALVRQHTEGGGLSRTLMQSPSVLEERLRELRGKLYAGSPSYRWGSHEQCGDECTDSMCGLPRVVSSWEDGIPRMSEGSSDRVNRLRAIGNAVIPQITEWIGRRIIEWEKSLSH